MCIFPVSTATIDWQIALTEQMGNCDVTAFIKLLLPKLNLTFKVYATTEGVSANESFKLTSRLCY